MNDRRWAVLLSVSVALLFLLAYVSVSFGSVDTSAFENLQFSLQLPCPAPAPTPDAPAAAASTFLPASPQAEEAATEKAGETAQEEAEKDTTLGKVLAVLQTQPTTAASAATTASGADLGAAGKPAGVHASPAQRNASEDRGIGHEGFIKGAILLSYGSNLSMSNFALAAAKAQLLYSKWDATNLSSGEGSLLSLVKDKSITAQVAQQLKDDSALRGTLSCLLSHRQAWQYIKDKPADHAYLIFDDVAMVDEDFHVSLAEVMAEAPLDWEVLGLSAPDWYYFHGNAILLSGELLPGRLWLRPTQKDPGAGVNEITAAYAIRPSGARKLLSIQNPIQHVLALEDLFRMHFHSIITYLLHLPLVKRTGGSSLCHEGLGREHVFRHRHVPPLPFVPDPSPGVYSLRSEAPYSRAFVINRRSDAERIQMFHSFARSAGVQAERFDAVDKDAMSLNQLVKDLEITAHVASMLRNHPELRGRVACTLSHNRVWRRIAQESPEKTFLVFEDDTMMPKDMLRRLKQAMDHVPSDWDFLYLNHNRLWGEYVGGRFWIRPYSSSSQGTTNALANAYMITPLGARRMLRFQSPIWFDWSNDSNMRKHFGHFTAYLLVESLAPQSGIHSTRLAEAAHRDR